MRTLSLLCFAAIVTAVPLRAWAQLPADSGVAGLANPLEMPAVGAHSLRVLSPTVLEMTLITTKPPEGRAARWDFADEQNRPRLPEPKALRVTVNGASADVASVGFKRRALYAPLARRDLRIGSYLYLTLARPVPEGARIEVKSAAAPDLIAPGERFAARADRMRYSPAVHVNQVGYGTDWPKKAMVGYYLGSLGEMEVGEGQAFHVVAAKGSGKPLLSGRLKRREDTGFTYTTLPYQKVYEADFSALKTPGEYRLLVPGLGASYPFFIHDGIAAAFARSYALGIYHQRCGGENAPPFTRFPHAPCHTAPAEIPTMAFQRVNQVLSGESSSYKSNPRHTAPQLKDVDSSLYPFVNKGPVDVSGGHHDAGDYSKYVANSAQFIHHLVFAADAFPGAAALDNLGLPESGDGKSDLLQLAKWEADFLAKMQDADGGFYFLVYPRDRRYENNVLPDRGDPQVVFPKTTSVTAAAVAALAQTASSPHFRKAFPEAAALYREKAQKGWAFLRKAIEKHGRDGAYQKITHYGDTFMHDDELAWAATEMFLLDGDEAAHRMLLANFDPASPETKRWTWVRLFEGYGCAIRSYAFATRTGRIASDRLNPQHLEKCLTEIRLGAQDQARFAAGCAYNTSFPDVTKRFRTAGWYFPMDAAFDIAVGAQLEPSPGYTDAIIGNLNYEGGANPNNVTFLTGLGWRRQRDIVHHYAMNDRRVLPPPGLPLGSIQAGFMFLDPYKKELGEITFPPDGAEDNAYPLYDRWGDSFNVTTEFVISNQAKGLAALSYLMAQTPLKAQPYRPAASAKIAGVPDSAKAGAKVTVRLHVPGMDTRNARIVWEANGEEPVFGQAFPFTPRAGENWIEAEAQWPDGRRAIAVLEFIAR